MARQARDLTQSEWFHVVHRGADRQDIFASDRDRHLFETLTGEAFERHGVEPHAYALMSNHVHLLGRVGDGGSLSEAMHHLGSRYALAFNKATRRDGPLFTSRFHSTAVTSDAQLAQTARYIHRNPLAFVPSRALVAYRWSSLGPICGRRTVPAWLRTDVIGADGTPEAYLAYVLSPQPADRFPFGNLAPLQPTTVDQIVQAVADLGNVAVSSVHDPDAAIGELRTLAIMLSFELRVGDAREIAGRFGMSDPRSARRAARRGRVRLIESERFAALRERVLIHLETLNTVDVLDVVATDAA